jgi:hypothetical protein
MKIQIVCGAIDFYASEILKMFFMLYETSMTFAIVAFMKESRVSTEDSAAYEMYMHSWFI